ncbi:DUF397 domain-containing protein [Nocardiopsis sp. FIRDI 009]|uniref:DUF397 domain-containing protein n=1 Tax=Nocardiopsis sp. FIRDI 009 TaxID=714197 RepID=UPI000E225CF1|nr:DUF397 domain-containing protein [Nocardiopsis sp. FIRDI 009]
MRPSPNLKFRKSSHSAGASECVEVADVDGGSAVRDSTRPEHGRLTFPSRERATAVRTVRSTL